MFCGERLLGRGSERLVKGSGPLARRRGVPSPFVSSSTFGVLRRGYPKALAVARNLNAESRKQRQCQGLHFCEVVGHTIGLNHF